MFPPLLPISRSENRRNRHHLAPFTEPSSVYTCVVCTRARNRKAGTRATQPRTGTHSRCTESRRTSLLTFTHEWERAAGSRGAGKRERRHRADPALCAREPSFGWTPERQGDRERERVSARARALVVGSSVCAYVEQPLFGAAAVLPPARFCRESRAYCICKATLLARTRHFPFSKSILAPCAPAAQSTVVDAPTARAVHR